MAALKSQPKLVLFGGDTPNGPASDIWLYDIESESVILIQWKLVDDKGRAPPRAFYRSICEYTYKGKQYITVLEVMIGTNMSIPYSRIMYIDSI